MVAGKIFHCAYQLAQGRKASLVFNCMLIGQASRAWSYIRASRESTPFVPLKPYVKGVSPHCAECEVQEVGTVRHQIFESQVCTWLFLFPAPCGRHRAVMVRPAVARGPGHSMR